MSDLRLNTCFFREDFRSFGTGTLSLCMERFGGIESIGFLNMRTFAGKTYPERYQIPIFNRKGFQKIRPFLAAAIYFEKLCSDNTLFRYAPEDPEIFADALKSRYMDMTMGKKSIAFRLKENSSGQFSALISRPHYDYTTGRYFSKMNQFAHYETSWLPDQMRGSDFDPEWPFSEDEVTIQRKDPVQDPESGALIFEIGLQYREYEETLFMAMYCDQKLTFITSKMLWKLEAPVSGKDLYFSFGFAKDRDEALQEARAAVETFSADWERQTAPARYPQMPEIRIQGIPEVTDFAKTYPGYQHAAVIFEDDKECAIRAAQEKYGYFAMWDHIFPIRDFLVMGEPEVAKKALRYVVTYPHVDTSILVSMQTVPAVNEYLAFTGDMELVQELMPYFRKFYDFARNFVHPGTGLIRNTLACAVDIPEEMGCSGLFYESGINGWWYDFCRGLQNMALALGDTVLAQEAGESARKIKKSYLKKFFVEEEGFLLVAFPSRRTQKFVPLFGYTNTLGLEYPHGDSLLKPVQDQLAAYQVSHLRHPLGHSAVSRASDVPNISMKAVHMNQHLGHESRCARLGGRADEVYHLLKGYLRVFSTFRNAQETFNLCYCSGDQTMRCDWQTFSATGAMQMILRGAAGLDWHSGGLRFVPAADDHKISIRNFQFRNSRWDFECSGSGAFVGKMLVNRKRICGTMQIPQELMEQPGDKTWKIIRSEEAPEHPVLLTAPDLPVKSLRVKENTLAFSAGKRAFSTIEFYAPFPPEILRNGKRMQFETHPRNIYSAAGIFDENDHFIIKEKKI